MNEDSLTFKLPYVIDINNLWNSSTFNSEFLARILFSQITF